MTVVVLGAMVVKRDATLTVALKKVYLQTPPSPSCRKTTFRFLSKLMRKEGHPLGTHGSPEIA